MVSAGCGIECRKDCYARGAPEATHLDARGEDAYCAGPTYGVETRNRPLHRHELTPQPGSPGAWERLRNRLGVKTGTAQLGAHRLILPELVDPIAYIEAHGAAGGAGDLPYWTRIWPASIVLASFMTSGKDRKSGRLLELGAGLGVPGLFAAAQGRQVVLTDLEPDALEFARAAVELNHFEDRVSVQPLDWTAPSADLDRFDTILGSEILYHRPLYPAIVSLLTLLIAPGGSVFIAHEERPFGISFFRLAEEQFLIRSTSSQVRDGAHDGPCKVFLHALRERRARGIG